MLCLTILKIKNFSKYMKNFSILFSLIALSGLFGLNSLAKSNNNVAEEISSLSPSEAAAKLLKNNDANKDGKLAKNEVNLSFRMKRFKKVDKNMLGKKSFIVGLIKFVDFKLFHIVFNIFFPVNFYFVLLF